MNTASDVTPNLFAALVKAQRHAKAVDLDGKNQHFKYRYASAENLINEGRASLSSAGLALMVTAVVLFAKELVNGVVQNMIRVTYILAHESGEAMTYEREWPTIEERGRPLDKAEGGALTTSLGYAIRDVLLLPRHDEFADMDRRDDRDHEPQQRQQVREEPRREEPRREEPRREEPEPRREEPRRDEPANDTDRRSRPVPSAEAGEQWESMLAAIKAGESIRDQLEKCVLTNDKRLALAYISRAYKAAAADDERGFIKVAGEARAEPALLSSTGGTALRDLVVAEIRPAWEDMQKAKKAKEAAA